MEESKKHKILIVDDSAINRSILADILDDEFSILEAEDGVEALQIIKQYGRKISLILLDLVMPNMDGLEVLAAMNKGEWANEIPVIMISQENSPTYVERAYELGATEFINRPFNVYMVRQRVINTIMLYAKQRSLIDLVSQQVYEREKTNDLMINILSHIVEFRNGESGLHILHVNTITEALLKRLIKKTDKYNLSYSDVETIVVASSLHDIGKISVPDEILNKPGKLTAEEFEVIKKHSQAGADMLSSLTEYLAEPLVIAARDICNYHHERYDGKGYPKGLAGDEIPISAQVVSIADVYDALISERCYKKAFSHEKAIEMIENGECGSFNPVLLECLRESADFLKSELKINSAAKRNLRKIKRMTNEMLSQNKFSATSNSINYLEQARIKYEFFASMSQEIQFEYTVSPSILTISEWCAEKFNLPSIIVNFMTNNRLMEIIGGTRALELFKLKLERTTKEQPITQFLMKITVDGQPRTHKVFCRANWSNDNEPKIIGAIGKIIDIEEDHQKMLSLKKKASVDFLTNIYNRDYAENYAKELLADGSGRKFAFMIIDLDDFKNANNTYGHMFGDTVLKKIGEILSGCTRKEDVVARIGGDEFTVFVEYKNEEIFKTIVKRIYDSLNGAECGPFKISVSIGAATTEQAGYDYKKLFNFADTAVYYSKRNGKSSYTFYDESMTIINRGITPAES